MSWELMSYGELMSGGTNVLDSLKYVYTQSNSPLSLQKHFNVMGGSQGGSAKGCTFTIFEILNTSLMIKESLIKVSIHMHFSEKENIPRS